VLDYRKTQLFNGSLSGTTRVRGLAGKAGVLVLHPLGRTLLTQLKETWIPEDKNVCFL